MEIRNINRYRSFVFFERLFYLSLKSLLEEECRRLHESLRDAKARPSEDEDAAALKRHSEVPSPLSPCTPSRASKPCFEASNAFNSDPKGKTLKLISIDFNQFKFFKLIEFPYK